MKKNLQLILLCFIVFSSTVNAQNNSNSLWRLVTKESLESSPKMRRNSFPTSAFYYQLNLSSLKNILKNAPVRGLQSSQVIVEFPTASGVMEKYRVWDSPIMHPDLSAKYPLIKTYCAQGIDDPTATMRFSITPFGLNTFTLSGKASTNYIDPYTKDLNYYIVYDKESLKGTPQNFECFTNDIENLPSLKGPSINIMANTNDQTLRTFRLAQSCNAEYGNIFATTPGTEKADILAQMVLTINRVNGIYERDLAITLQFIPNNDTIIFFGSTSADPWSTEFNTKTAQTIDARVGVANYDIGHNFNTSGGGNAGCIGCVCLSTSQTGTHKGRGETGSSNPTGDAFDIDYVAHEMGHQFGGYHTMNTCSRSGNNTSEVEPASGTSIMGYAGICPTNTQAHSNDDFNFINIDEISSNIHAGGNSTCAVVTSLTDQPPLADAGSDYVIPKGTAFILEGSATDPDGTASLTYNWSENDPAQSPGNGAPMSTYTVGPLYNVLRPTSTPIRYMPNLASVVANNLTPTWEVTPSVARILNFSFLVRDNDVLGGQTSGDVMKVTVNNSGPFVVTSQNTPSMWNAGASEIITWNVAGTNSGAVNTANVTIYLSLDSGYTYPFILASNVPNNGSANIVVPASGSTTTKGRIMVRGAGNIFYALNSNIITIVSSEFVMNFNNANISICGSSDTTYNFVYNTYLNFSDTTTFSAFGIPVGSSVTFSPATAINDSTAVQMVLSGLNTATPGTYTIQITGTSASVTKSTSVTLSVSDPNPSVASLSSPLNGAIGISSPLNLAWNANSTPGIIYEVDVATDSAFTNIIANNVASTTNTFLVSSLLNSTTYYWRVRAYSICGTSLYSNAWSFTTGTCQSLTSANVPILISATGTPTITSTLQIPTITGTIADVNLVGLVGTHTYINDLTFKLRSPQGTIITLFGGICNNEDNFDCNFDDSAPSGALPCPPIGGGTYQPQMPLSTFNGQNPSGIWTLTVADGANQDGGSLDGWGLQICTNTVSGISAHTIISDISIYPNPANDLFTVNVNGNANEIYIVKITNNLGQLLQSRTMNSNSSLNIDCRNYNSGIYFINVSGKNSSETRKVILAK